MNIRKTFVALLLAIMWLFAINAVWARGPEGPPDHDRKDAIGETTKNNAGNTAADSKKSTDSDNAGKAASTPASPTTEEQLNLLNEKVRKLEEMVERQQRVI